MLWNVWHVVSSNEFEIVVVMNGFKYEVCFCSCLTSHDNFIQFVHNCTFGQIVLMLCPIFISLYQLIFIVIIPNKNHSFVNCHITSSVCLGIVRSPFAVWKSYLHTFIANIWFVSSISYYNNLFGFFFKKNSFLLSEFTSDWIITIREYKTMCYGYFWLCSIGESFIIFSGLIPTDPLYFISFNLLGFHCPLCQCSHFKVFKSKQVFFEVLICASLIRW